MPRAVVIIITILAIGSAAVWFVFGRDRASLPLSRESSGPAQTELRTEPRAPGASRPRLEDNKWLVEFDFTAAMSAGAEGSASWRGKGDAEIELPESGPAKGKDRYSINFQISELFSCTQTGVFSVDGEVQDNIFTFIPTLESQGMNCTPSGGAMSGIIPPNAGLAIPNTPISLEIRNGSEFAQELFPGPGFSGQVVWRLKGKKREHWAVDFSGKDQWTRGFGSFPGGQIGAGIKVNWSVNVAVEVEEDSCEADATVNIASVEPVSDPEDTFMITQEVGPSPSQSIRCQKSGRSVRLAFLLDRDPRNADGWGYWWRYEFELTPGALDSLQEAGVPLTLAQEVMRGFGNEFCQRQGERLVCRPLSFPAGTEPDQNDEGPGVVPNRTDWYTIQLADGDQSAAGAQGERIVVRRLR